MLPSFSFKGKKYKVIDIQGYGKTFDNYKNELGGDLVIEFQKRKGEYYMNTYITQTGKSLYGSEDNCPAIEKKL